MKSLLFLCTGNYYRSRFAEELFNFLAPTECPGWVATSRGIAVDLGGKNVGPIAHSTVEALHQRGVQFNLSEAKTPRQLVVSDLEAADHIVAVKYAEHSPLLRERFSSWLALSDPSRIEFWHVHDIDVMAPQEALPLIEKLLAGLMRRLVNPLGVYADYVSPTSER